MAVSLTRYNSTIMCVYYNRLNYILYALRDVLNKYESTKTHKFRSHLANNVVAQYRLAYLSV